MVYNLLTRTYHICENYVRNTAPTFSKANFHNRFRSGTKYLEKIASALSYLYLISTTSIYTDSFRTETVPRVNPFETSGQKKYLKFRQTKLAWIYKSCKKNKWKESLPPLRPDPNFVRDTFKFELIAVNGPGEINTVTENGKIYVLIGGMWRAAKSPDGGRTTMIINSCARRRARWWRH